MKLKDEYIRLSNDDAATAQYSETGEGKFGKIFSFQNTNYRNILTFIESYHKFKLEAEGKNRKEWESYLKNGQEKMKHHTIHMMKSKFFHKREDIFYSSAKGAALGELNTFFSKGKEDNERWLIVYLLLIDSYFDDTPNYILETSKDVEKLFYQNTPAGTLIDDIICDFLKKFSTKNFNVFSHDYLYLDTFYRPFDKFNFMHEYFLSSQQEKDELHNYISDEYMHKTNYSCVTKKYKTGGNFTKKMLLDNAKILFLTNYIAKTFFGSFSDFIAKIVKRYSEIFVIDNKKVENFIFGKFKHVFENCYLSIANPEYLDTTFYSGNITKEEEESILKEISSNSLMENPIDILKVNSIFRKKALEKAHFKCEFEEIHDCARHYFEGNDGQNYVELHHLIPREFSNDFEVTIETIHNYVCLCPRCHRFVHSAIDYKRIPALEHLFKNRYEDLKKFGIDIDIKKLKSYYRIKEKIVVHYIP